MDANCTCDAIRFILQRPVLDKLEHVKIHPHLNVITGSQSTKLAKDSLARSRQNLPRILCASSGNEMAGTGTNRTRPAIAFGRIARRKRSRWMRVRAPEHPPRVQAGHEPEPAMIRGHFYFPFHD